MMGEDQCRKMIIIKISRFTNIEMKTGLDKTILVNDGKAKLVPGNSLLEYTFLKVFRGINNCT